MTFRLGGTWKQRAIGSNDVVSVNQPTAPARAVKLGPDIFAGEQPQYVIARWEWQRVRSLGDWTLVGTTGMYFGPPFH